MLIAIAVLLLLILALAAMIGFANTSIGSERNSLKMSFLVFVLTYLSAYAYHLFITQQLQLNQTLSIRLFAGLSTLLATLGLLAKRRTSNNNAPSSNFVGVSRAMISGLMLCLLTIVFVSTPIDQFFQNLKQNISQLFIAESSGEDNYEQALTPTESNLESD